MITLHDAPPSSHGLLYLATFGAAERALINSNSELRAAIKKAEPSAWAAILDQHRIAEQQAVCARTAHIQDDDDGMRRQALCDLEVAARHYAGLTDGRRTGLFVAVCRVAKYVSHGHLSEPEIVAAFTDAARANGALQKQGMRWAEATIRSAIVRGRNDALPPLARTFRSVVRA